MDNDEKNRKYVEDLKARARRRRKRRVPFLAQIVLILLIFGLVGAAVLKGYEAKKAKEVAQVVADVAAIRSAMLSFYKKYKALPGDYDRANIYLPGCSNKAPNWCVRGDGNGMVGWKHSYDSLPKKEHTRLVAQAPTVKENLEQLMVWRHLALSGFLRGVEKSVDVRNPDNMKFGVSHPASSIGRGGYLMGYLPPATKKQKPQHVLRLSISPLTPLIECGRSRDEREACIDKNVVKPSIAQAIDQKMDDGKPNSGSVRGLGSASFCIPNKYTKSDYLTEARGRNCMMIFDLNKTKKSQ